MSVREDRQERDHQTDSPTGYGHHDTTTESYKVGKGTQPRVRAQVDCSILVVLEGLNLAGGMCDLSDETVMSVCTPFASAPANKILICNSFF